MRIVVTGATGFIGSRLVERLTGLGHEVVTVSRTLGHDIRRPETLTESFFSADWVVHLAALVQSRPGPFDETNLDGLRNVLSVAEQEGVGRFLGVSSFTIFGPSPADSPHTEESISERVSFFHGYDRTKYEGYRIFQEWRRRLSINLVFPAVVYGRGPMTEGNILVHLLQRWKRLRVAPLPAYGQPRWNFVSVDDVVAGIVAVIDHAPIGEDYILGGENSSLSRLAELFAEVSETRILRIGLPSTVFRLSAYFEDIGSRLGRFPPLVLPQTAGFFLNNWEFSSQKAMSKIGYTPHSLRHGLQRTVQWMKKERLV